jgi:ribA/ribD-fused uncharacterized protein
MYNNRMVDTAEHGYQADKVATDEDRQKVLEADSPVKAKLLGRALKTREGFEWTKIGVMRSVLRAKFEWNKDLRQKLIDTEDQEIVESNVWHDNFWGNCTCGRDECTRQEDNWLGILLMELREMYIAEQGWHLTDDCCMGCERNA